MVLNSVIMYKSITLYKKQLPVSLRKRATDFLYRALATIKEKSR